MNRKLSERLLIAEAAVLGLPVSGLLSVMVILLSTGSEQRVRPWTIVALAAGAVFAGWWLIVKALQGGAEALRSAHRAWWLAALIGLSMVLAAAVSMLLPDSPKSSSAASFREDLERCIVGVPLVVIFAHLWAEARFRLSA
jgi:NADH:ubiquinone oxidoreductase subunit 6 (subunit J)